MIFVLRGAFVKVSCTLDRILVVSENLIFMSKRKRGLSQKL